MSVKRQCELLEVNRTSIYYKPVELTGEAILREEYIHNYNHERPHSSLEDERPAVFHRAKFSSQMNCQAA